MTRMEDFREIWCLDFEFQPFNGHKTVTICMVAKELRSGKLIRCFGDDLVPGRPPFTISRDQLFIAYYASAEMDCFIELGWAAPPYLLDLYAEFRCMTSGRKLPTRYGLLGALAHFGFDSMTHVEKEAMRNLALRGAPFSPDEKRALLDYCQSDVEALEQLVPRMAHLIDLPYALLRGRYMIAAAMIERNGIPLDVTLWNLLSHQWEALQMNLINRYDHFGVFEGRTFREVNFKTMLRKLAIPWPRHESGKLDLREDTFKTMARLHPEIAPLKELRKTLSSMHLNRLSVGGDGRNRVLLSAFASVTGRNQPSNAKFIFGLAAWLRGLIKPTKGYAVSYIDYEQQEFGIAAALSGDKRMQEAYASGDPYLAFAKQAGAIPPDASKESHPQIRDQFKECALGVQYGMREASLAQRLGIPRARGRELINLHQDTYSQFWEWRERVLARAQLEGYLRTAYGWKIHVTPETKALTLGNFLMQGNGAEILRLACIFGIENKVRICAPVHDALLIEATESQIEAVSETMQGYMEKAARTVLAGFPLRTEKTIIPSSKRYMDKKGIPMWNTVMEIIGEGGKLVNA